MIFLINLFYDFLHYIFAHFAMLNWSLKEFSMLKNEFSLFIKNKLIVTFSLNILKIFHHNKNNDYAISNLNWIQSDTKSIKYKTVNVK